MLPGNSKGPLWNVIAHISQGFVNFFHRTENSRNEPPVELSYLVEIRRTRNIRILLVLDYH